MGTPCTMFANATPHRNAGTAEPTTIIVSKPFFQRRLSRWWRYSNDTPRRIKASRISSSGR
jgi:hypothetical protein